MCCYAAPRYDTDKIMKLFYGSNVVPQACFSAFSLYSVLNCKSNFAYGYNDVLLNANFRSALPITDLLNSARCAHPDLGECKKIINDESLLVQVTAWCQAKSYSLL